MDLKSIKPTLEHISILTFPLHCLGKGRLACVSFAGGKAYPRRRHIMVSGNGSEEARNVAADINMLSYYNKARSGAQDVATHEGRSNSLLNLHLGSFVVLCMSHLNFSRITLELA